MYSISNMKMLTVCALVCAFMVLTGAAAFPGASAGKGGKGQTGEHAVVKGSVALDNSRQKSNKTYYFYFVPKAMTWADAEKHCQSFGANLASIHNVYDYHVVQHLILRMTHEQKQAWVGGSDAQQEGYWFWSDGTRFVYNNWCSGEPNDANGQHCLQINFSVKKCWDDVQCHYKLPSVCGKTT
ncbi:ladderlectin-like [Dicentrarchus labrax]|uniref:C-type lectin domain-containing protein n=1 Tax=Dicentrarchus labrax TaxID=13489 RepID=A0A8C4HCA3_DICLA|nr:ladderlectin-like [Dicentrarchus labrax]